MTGRAVAWSFLIALFAALPLAAATDIAAPNTDATSPPTLRVLKLREYATNNPHRNVGLEMEMLRDFALSQGMTLEWVDAFRPAELYDRLLAREGDLVIGTLPPSLEKSPALAATEAIDVQRYRAVGRLDAQLRDPLDLAGLRVAVRWSSPLWPYLERLQRRLPGLHLEALPNNLPQERIFELVANGSYDVTITLTHGALDLLAEFPRLKYLFDLSDAEPVTWHLRRDDAALKMEVNSFISRFQPGYIDPDSKFGDLDAIEQRRVLRVITRPDAQNYFIDQGRQSGFEYELISRFAERHGLRTEILVGRDDAEILDWLQRGIGDIVSTRVASNLLRGEPGLATSRIYHHALPTILSAADAPYRSPTQLAGKTIAIYRGSVHENIWRQLADGAPGAVGVYADPDEPLETFAARLVEQAVDAALVDGHVVDDVLAIQPGLRANFSLGQDRFYRWTVRGQDSRLLAAVDRFLQGEYKSETYNILTNRYFGAARYARLNKLDKISPFDPLVMVYADRYGFDWRLITAQMFQESRFDPLALSPAGATGLMQMMPGTATALGFSDIADPETGIHAGIKYLYLLRDRFDKQIPMRERTWFALAAYNVGFERIQRARARAVDLRLDPDKWFGNVERAIVHMAKTAEDRSLECRCGQTVDYVSSIRSLYSTYRRLRAPLGPSLPSI